MTPPTDKPPCCTAGRIALCALPFLIVGALTAMYLISPRFYLTYIIEEANREHGAVEIATFSSAILGGLLLLGAGWRLFRREGRRLTPRSGAAIVGVVGLAGVFFAGEEVSWGQTWFKWKTPPAIREHTIETNLHNTDIPVQAMGSVFIAGVFFGLPLVWRLRRGWLPDQWGVAIPAAPEITTVAVGFAWKEVKTVAKFLIAEEDRLTTPVWRDFLDQFNEHKEMLIAIGLLMYGVSRWRALRSGG